MGKRSTAATQFDSRNATILCQVSFCKTPFSTAPMPPVACITLWRHWVTHVGIISGPTHKFDHRRMLRIMGLPDGTTAHVSHCLFLGKSVFWVFFVRIWCSSWTIAAFQWKTFTLKLQVRSIARCSRNGWLVLNRWRNQRENSEDHAWTCWEVAACNWRFDGWILRRQHFGCRRSENGWSAVRREFMLIRSPCYLYWHYYVAQQATPQKLLELGRKSGPVHRVFIVAGADDESYGYGYVYRSLKSLHSVRFIEFMSRSQAVQGRSDLASFVLHERPIRVDVMRPIDDVFLASMFLVDNYVKGNEQLVLSHFIRRQTSQSTKYHTTSEVFIHLQRAR